jgi:HK97 family phage portal protein
MTLKLGKFHLTLAGPKTNTLEPPSSVVRSTTTLSPAQAFLRGEDCSGGPALAAPYQQSVWVHAAVSALAQAVSAIPFRISRGDRSGENILTSGPAVELFNRPHTYLDRFRFWEFIVTWYCLRGEMFIVALDKAGNLLPIRNPQSAIRNLLVLNPDQFRHVVQGHELAGWEFTGSRLGGPLGSMRLLPEEVIHDFLPNPYLFWRGLSPLSVALLAAQTDFASAQFMKGLMLNNADAGVIVRTQQQLSPEQTETLLARLRERKRSAGVADRPLILSDGAEIIRPTLSSADLQFMENRKLNRQEICAAFFRIPQTLLGFTEDANRAVAEQESLNFIQNTILPLCARLEAAIEPVIKAFGPHLRGWFDTDSIPLLQKARRSRVETAVKLFGMGYPANAINKALDLGLPHLPWGDKGYVGSALQPVVSQVQAE